MLSFIFFLIILAMVALVFATKFDTVQGKDGPYLTRLVIGRLRFHLFHRPDEDEETHSHPWDFWTFPFIGYFEDVLTYNTTGQGFYYRNRYIREMEPYLVRQYVAPFKWHKRSFEHSHRIAHAESCKQGGPISIYREAFRHSASAKIFTIVWTGQRAPSWGFSRIIPGCKPSVAFTDWRIFIAEKGLAPLKSRSARA